MDEKTEAQEARKPSQGHTVTDLGFVPRNLGVNALNLFYPDDFPRFLTKNCMGRYG